MREISGLHFEELSQLFDIPLFHLNGGSQVEKLLDALLDGIYQFLFFFFWFVMISFRLKDNKNRRKIWGKNISQF